MQVLKGFVSPCRFRKIRYSFIKIDTGFKLGGLASSDWGLWLGFSGEDSGDHRALQPSPDGSVFQWNMWDRCHRTVVTPFPILCMQSHVLTMCQHPHHPSSRIPEVNDKSNDEDAPHDQYTRGPTAPDLPTTRAFPEWAWTNFVS
ncbi:unnamed protein product [Vicia faba]|uniref:Uncharacterized protein n=1 Tax=Vicia faba TaxID=3906 RepID=A0AAV0YC88_VICFA|nr:unnamed protein product [Vicia faba]